MTPAPDGIFLASTIEREREAHTTGRLQAGGKRGAAIRRIVTGFRFRTKDPQSARSVYMPSLVDVWWVSIIRFYDVLSSFLLFGKCQFVLTILCQHVISRRAQMQLLAKRF